MNDVAHIQQALRRSADKKKAALLSRFFKTGRGEYAEGDRFLGVTVPLTRALVKQYRALESASILALLSSSFHEERLLALLIMVDQYQSGTKAKRKEIYQMYLRHTRFINNWDLVDLSAYHIVGAHLDKQHLAILFKLATSKSLWERRIAMIATFHFIYQGDPDPALEVAERLVYDRHDLIQKAVGWMLREVGKRCSLDKEKAFLERYAATMPRTALRYALERMSSEEKKYFMEKKRYA